MSARKSLDTGVAVTPTPRAIVFPTGQPAALDATDTDVAANTSKGAEPLTRRPARTRRRPRSTWEIRRHERGQR